MSVYKVTGIVTYISPVETFGSGKESKRIIVETQEKYANYFPITFYGPRMEAIKDIKKGDLVEVETYPGGRLKKGDDTQAFAFLNGYNCLVITTGSMTNSQPQSPVANSIEPNQQTRQTKFALNDDDYGVPF